MSMPISGMHTDARFLSQQVSAVDQSDETVGHSIRHEALGSETQQDSNSKQDEQAGCPFRATSKLTVR